MALTLDEKKELARHIQKGSSVICSSIAQLHLSSPDPNATKDETGIIQILRKNGAKKWKFTNIEGALLLIRDKQQNTFFRVYDLDEYKLRFHYELYENLEYNKLSDTFHCFEMEGCVCGFNFSDVKIAEKFLHRVSKSIPRSKPAANEGRKANTKRSTANHGITSPGFKPPPMPSVTKFETIKGKGALPQEYYDEDPGYGDTSGNLFLQNGLLDAENIPREWKKILRNAGIKKRDLRNPQMLEVIRETLLQFNISLDPPPLDMDDNEIRKHYTRDQLAEYERYKREMEAYEAELEKYNREMAEYEEFQKSQQKLVEWEKQAAAANPMLNQGPNNGADRLRQSVMKFQGIKLDEVLPALTEDAHPREKLLPRMSVAKPYLPALPAIDSTSEPEALRPQAQLLSTVNKAANRMTKKQMDAEPRPVSKNTRILGDLINNRQSRMIMRAGFLDELKKNEAPNTMLKHVSMRHSAALPDLAKVNNNDKAGIMSALIDRMKEQRQYIDDEDESDGDDDSGFSDAD